MGVSRELPACCPQARYAFDDDRLPPRAPRSSRCAALRRLAGTSGIAPGRFAAARPRRCRAVRAQPARKPS
ncbi:hypothetical protein C7S15_7579 [Burkholderia cepacia]|nr:hypothetical protein [Burkholderia cepacia]